MNIRSIFKGLPRRTAFNTVTLLLGGLICSATIALAQVDYGTQSVIATDIIVPYDGYLMVDSAPLTGVRMIKFDLRARCLPRARLSHRRQVGQAQHP